MKICVFSGSSPGLNPVYREIAREFGVLLAAEGIGIVYGGASVGVMGALADAARGAGGEVIGVIPKALADREVAHAGLSALHIVSSMHERKAMMAGLSDAFVAMPGGIGTLEEIFEVWTWTQLGLHAKPCGLLNVAGFFDGLSAFLDHVVEEEFLKPVHRGMMILENEPAALLRSLRSYTPPVVDKWINREQS